MRAATIHDGKVHVAEHPDPEPGHGEILLRVHAAGINGADLLQRRGAYPAPPGAPADVPGLELAGEVVALGPGATRFVLGERAMAIVGGGGQAELCTVHERQAMPVPVAVGAVEAGGLPEVFTTAHDALFAQAGLRMGERLLVSGAAGGVGSAAVQLAAAAGAHVTASVRDPALRDGVRALGAHEALDPDDTAEAGPYDVLLELVGAPNLEANVRAMQRFGRVVVIGVGAGFKAQVSLLSVMGRRLTIGGSTLRARPLEEKAATARAMEREVLPLFERGVLRVPVAARFALDEVAAAYDRFAAGGKLGKVILELQ
ncbi:MAG: zinc-binding dehydrogenase [Solirubrobacteraceae bacterium]|nr:zinc-binding dehydrogenase [Solirubrobacteraceae bacterium]